WPGFPWNDGDIAGMAIRHARKLIGKGPSTNELLDFYFPFLERLDESSSEREIALVHYAMPALFHLSTPDLARFGKAVAMRPFAIPEGLLDALKEQGLPDDVEALQNYFGVRPKKPSDEPITIGGETKPASDWAPSEEVAQAIAKHPLAIAIAVSLATRSGAVQTKKIDEMSVTFTSGPEQQAKEHDPLPWRIAEIAGPRAWDDALALAKGFQKTGPPKTYGRWTQVHANALLVLTRAAAAAGKTDPAFDAMLEPTLQQKFWWPEHERYLRTMT